MTSNRIYFQAAGKDAVNFILCDGWICASMRGISEAHSLAHERSSASVTKKILKLRRKLTEMGEKETEREEFIRAIRKFMEMRTLTKQVLNELIDHIDVYEAQGTGKNKTQRLFIYYKFVGYLDIDPTQCRPNYTADIREGVAIEYVSCEPSDSLKELFPDEYGDDDEFL